MTSFRSSGSRSRISDSRSRKFLTSHFICSFWGRASNSEWEAIGWSVFLVGPGWSQVVERHSTWTEDRSSSASCAAWRAPT